MRNPHATTDTTTTSVYIYITSESSQYIESATAKWAFVVIAFASIDQSTKMSTLPKERYLSKAPASAQNNSNLRTIHGQSILVGQLPEDFLRIDGSAPDDAPVHGQSQLEIDQQLAASLQQQYDHQAHRRDQWASQYRAQLVITCVEAKLTKNYGLVNMNPYIRLRIGHTIYETKTR